MQPIAALNLRFSGAPQCDGDGPSPIAESMPSLFRFLIVVAVLSALVYGAMLALVASVQPVPRPMEQAIPASKLNPPKP